MTEPMEFKVNDIGGIISESIHNDNDYILNIAGGEGRGKSTLAKKINKSANIKSHNSYDVEQNTLFYPTTEEISDIYDGGHQFWVMQWDEAIRILFKLDWASIKSKAIIKDFAVNRALNMGTILCIPRMKDLNENFRNWRINLWGEVIERGCCVWFAPDWNMFAPDPWHWDENYKLIKITQGMSKNLSKFTLDDKLKIFSKCIGFEGYTLFEKEAGPEWERYLDLKDKKRTSLSAMTERSDKPRQIVQNMYNNGLKPKEIMKITGLADRMVYKACEALPNYESCPKITRLYNKAKVSEIPSKEESIREIRKDE
jgi:hypothetical protein